MPSLYRRSNFGQFWRVLTLITLLFATSGTVLAACSATEKNADYSAVGSGTSSSVAAKINATGDLVAVTAWCYPSCSPTSVKLGNQTAVQTSVSGAPGPGSPGTGQGFIFYILSAAASGSQTLTFTATGGAQQTQVSYIDFSTSSGCSFSHDTDSPLGSCMSNCGSSGAPGTINGPSISATAGDVLFDFTWSSEHINDINSPWSCPIYSGSGETQDCQFDMTRNVSAYILSAPGGPVANNTTDTHDSDTWQALLTSFSMSGTVSASGCPASAPVSGNNCFFIAANGSDSNAGTSESSPWQHAPGMPNCTANCKSHTPAAGQGFIFRGGDTWHLGNASASPYTGGAWDMSAFVGSESSCVYEGTQTGCIYYGVDPNWYSGSSWSRPVLTGDNPTSTSLVGSCAHQISGSNQMVILSPASIFDNFEMVGLCSNSPGDPGTSDTYLVYYGNGNGCQTGDTSPACMTFIDNVYVHGWTATTTAGHSTNSQPCVILGGGVNSLQSVDHLVIDGQDSSPGSCAWGIYPSFYHFRDSIVRYTNQGVGQWCHDIHDNIFEYMYEHNSGAGSHSNVLECNNDSTGNAIHQPANTPNVFYNNVFRHYDPTFMAAGQVNIWFCPNTMPEYWFNNVAYDTGGYNDGNFWAIAGSPTYAACTNTGKQYMFNNTLSGGQQPCHLAGSNTTGGQYLSVFNENLINTPWDGSGCTGRSDASNVAMSWASADAQGYTTGAAGMSDADTCANDSSKPCSPTSSSASTVNLGLSQLAYCTVLSTYASESAISSEAANACRYGTTDGCSYVVSNHTMNCPAQSAVARPTSGAWDSGAYQYSAASQTQPPQPAGNAKTAVQ